MRFSNKGYDDVKTLVTLTFPGLASGVYFMSLVWTYPDAKFIMGLCVVGSLIGGVLMSISTRRYEKREQFYDGRIIVKKTEEENKIYTLEYHGPIDDLDTKRALLFKVVSPNLGDE